MIFYCKPLLFCKKPYVIGGNGGHFWIQHPRKHKVYQEYSMQLKKKIIFADLCNYFIQKAGIFLYSSLTSWNFPCSFQFRLSVAHKTSVKTARFHTQLTFSKLLSDSSFPIKTILIFSGSDGKCCRTPSLLRQHFQNKTQCHNIHFWFFKELL
jgi:hypothetical protein